MPVPTPCPSCNRLCSLPPEVQGKKVRCPHCKEPFIPRAEEPPEAELPLVVAERLTQEPPRRRDGSEGRERSLVHKAPPRPRAPAARGTQGSLGPVLLLVIGAPLAAFCLISAVVLGVVLLGSRQAPAPAQPPPVAGQFPNQPAEDNERADPPRQVPFQVDPALEKAAGEVYLSDLQEFAWQGGPAGWSFGKNGSLGSVWARDGVILVRGAAVRKGLSMHPPDRGYTRVCYALGRRAKAVKGAVAISEDEAKSNPHPTRFLVLGDGQVLWRSNSITAKGQVQGFDVNAAYVNVLELRVYVEGGSSHGSHAAWVDPRVVPRTGPR